MVLWSTSLGINTCIFHYIPFVLPSAYLISMAEVTADTQINLLMEVEEVLVYSLHAHSEDYLSMTSAQVRDSNQTGRQDTTG